MTSPAQGELHVWTIDVRGPLDELHPLLSPDEAARAARFRFAPDRDAFVCTRGALRVLAASYLGISPGDVAFAYGSRGKPELPGLSFNVSHAGDVAVAAFAASGSVGADVELMREDLEVLALAPRFFTARENEALAGLSEHDRVRAFYSCWTRKEAFVKALGDGLSFELDRVEVSVAPEPARVVSIDGAPASSWSLLDLDVAPGYAGAVAVDSPVVEVSVRPWTAVSA